MKTILITGSTDGIGKLVAMNFAKEGHCIIVHGRNKKKLKENIAEIKQASNNSKISGYIADMTDMYAVKMMASAIKNDVDSIDILINNAGVFKTDQSKTKDGFDIRLTVNYLAPFVLTNEILPLLKKGDSPRIINLSSAAQSSLPMDVLLGHTHAGVTETYAQSKLALTMWSFYLAKNEPSITVIAVNPGSLLNTKMAKEAYGQHWSSADKGANILFALALLDEHANKSGEYFDNDHGSYSDAHADAYDDIKIKELIETTNAIVS